MRYQTLAAVSPVVGIVNEPPVAPLVAGTNGCVCVSWWKSTCQVNALGGQRAVLGVGARARVGDGVSRGVERAGSRATVMVAVGALLVVTCSVAPLLVALPNALRHHRRKVAPSSASAVVASV